MKAGTESAGTDGCTASTMEPVASLITGAKLFTGSYGTFLNRLPLVTKVLAIINSVCPSGAAGARLVVDDDRLTPVPGEFGAERARQNVDAGAGGIRHDDGDRTPRELGG